MKKLGTILVTGCGDIGIGVGRILKESGVAERCIGSDIATDHAGRFVFDACEVVPRANDEKYISKIADIIKKYDVELIIPTSVSEIQFFHNNRHHALLQNMPIILANEEALRVGLDKLETNKFLAANDLPHPWTYIVGEHAPRELPCIIKTRSGWGSKGVEIVHDADAVSYLTKRRPEDIWQEYVTPEDQEYTCGLYGCADGSIRTIIFRRALGGGLTVFGEVSENPEIDALLQAMARGLRLRGSINVQLRLSDKGPMVFEINPRFSSTVVFRHLLGFKDVLWSIEESMGDAPSPYAPAKSGIKFFKGYTEHITT